MYDSPDIPANYRPISINSNFNVLCGPYYEIIENGIYVGLALRLDEKHLNDKNIAHGGLLMTLADNALGRAAVYAYEGKKSFVTASMNSSFLKPAQLGDWLEARPIINRTGQRLAFADCPVYVGDALVFSASGIFAIVETPPK